jgi:hypothetical protein
MPDLTLGTFPGSKYPDMAWLGNAWPAPPLPFGMEHSADQNARKPSFYDVSGGEN